MFLSGGGLDWSRICQKSSKVCVINNPKASKPITSFSRSATEDILITKRININTLFFFLGYHIHWFGRSWKILKNNHFWHDRTCSRLCNVDGKYTPVPCLHSMFYPNRLNKLTEMRFKFPFNLIGRLKMAFSTGQSWCVLKSWCTGGGREQEIWCCFADGLNRKFISICGTSLPVPCMYNVIISLLKG